MKFIKCVVLGNTNVGKTCLLISYTTKSFPTDYIPSTFDNYSSGVGNDQTTNEYDLNYWDTLGKDEYDQVRPLSYTETDVFLICFSIISPSSFESVSNKWKNEIKDYSINVPVILVGTKLDLRNEKEINEKLATQNLSPITYEQGRAMMKDIGAVSYFECSALTRVGVEDVFKYALKVGVRKRTPPQQTKNNNCIIL